ncbi:hypothetical protein E2C01_070687 [Portunus trituberculatus]|uniref:Uncharacterized protein n=1 Tax=Portunus trituberculatus TaxID=210409 RepID=A0A5B7I2Y2_PORTR|nr:hypothetical protein [Portunus trituberculatus]
MVAAVSASVGTDKGTDSAHGRPTAAIVTVPSQSSVRTSGPITAGRGSQQAVLIGWEAVVVVVVVVVVGAG